MKYLKNKAFTKKVLFAFTIVLLQACYFGANPTFHDRELPGDLHLSAMDEEQNLALWEPMAGTSGGFSGVVGPTIYAIGWTDDFVIAKTHPLISTSLDESYPSSYITNSEIIALSDSSYFIYGLIEDQSDTSKYDKDKIHEKDGKWWHELYEVDKDSLAPFKEMTYWHIVEIKRGNSVYCTISEKDFYARRKQLNIPDTLSFFLTFDNLK